jgi:hypothetical protein
MLPSPSRSLFTWPVPSWNLKVGPLSRLDSNMGPVSPYWGCHTMWSFTLVTCTSNDRVGNVNVHRQQDVLNNPAFVFTIISLQKILRYLPYAIYSHAFPMDFRSAIVFLNPRPRPWISSTAGSKMMHQQAVEVVGGAYLIYLLSCCTTFWREQEVTRNAPTEKSWCFWGKKSIVNKHWP